MDLTVAQQQKDTALSSFAQRSIYVPSVTDLPLRCAQGFGYCAQGDMVWRFNRSSTIRHN